MRAPSGRSWSFSLTLGSSSAWLSSFWPLRYVVESFLIATTIDFGSSLRSFVLPAFGSTTSTPFCRSGVITMKMIKSTIMMSAMGVTLMFAIGPPLLPPTAIDMGRLLQSASAPGPAKGPAERLSLALLDELVEQLRAGVVHLDVEVLDLAVEVVEGPHRRHRDEEPEGRGDERLGDTGRDRLDAARPGERHAREGVDDAE